MGRVGPSAPPVGGNGSTTLVGAPVGETGAVTGSSAGNALGEALRGWRDRLSPLDVGLPVFGSRRASGLRREELSALAGLSVDYLVRLEQGRARNPSEQVVAALARALQLTAAERDHLHRLAHLPPPSSGVIDSHVPPSVQRLVARLGELPVAVFSADWTLVTWSPLWAALLGDPLGLPAAERNIVAAAFLGSLPVRRGSLTLEPALVADLRAATVRYPADRGLAELVRRCLAGSERFAELWRAGAVGEHTHDRKVVAHPAVGEVVLDCDVLTVPGADLKIVVYSAAAGSADAEKLDFLRVTGIAVG